MFRLFVLLIVLAVATGCASGRSGADRPTGMTGTSGGTTTGTGTSAPTTTLGTGGTADPAEGAVIPKEGDARLPDDSMITEAVIARLKEKGLHETIHVDSDDGVVTLEGTAPSMEVIEALLKEIQLIPGVVNVASELSVK